MKAPFSWPNSSDSIKPRPPTRADVLLRINQIRDFDSLTDQRRDHFERPERNRVVAVLLVVLSGVPGVDGQSFTGIEAAGLEEWLNGIRNDLRAKTYTPQAVPRVKIPKPTRCSRASDFCTFVIIWIGALRIGSWRAALRRSNIAVDNNSRWKYFMKGTGGDTHNG